MAWGWVTFQPFVIFRWTIPLRPMTWSTEWGTLFCTLKIAESFGGVLCINISQARGPFISFDFCLGSAISLNLERPKTKSEKTPAQHKLNEKYYQSHGIKGALRCIWKMCLPSAKTFIKDYVFLDFHIWCLMKMTNHSHTLRKWLWKKYMNTDSNCLVSMLMSCPFI